MRQNYHHSEETKRKISESLKGKMVGDKNPSCKSYVIEKIRQKANERYTNEEYRQKHKLAIRNYYKTHEHHVKGISKTQEQKEKMSISRKKWCKENPEKAKEVIEKSRATNIEKGTHRNERNPNWYGGISKIKIKRRTTKELKDKIKKRDGYRCQQCFSFQDELVQPLIVHHIDFNKLNDNETNLITLCNPCHSQLNYDRESWIDYFKVKQIQRGII